LSDDNAKSTKKGSLIIVGSGIQAIRRFTLESRQAVEQADRNPRPTANCGYFLPLEKLNSVVLTLINKCESQSCTCTYVGVFLVVLLLSPITNTSPTIRAMIPAIARTPPDTRPATRMGHTYHLTQSVH